MVKGRMTGFRLSPEWWGRGSRIIKKESGMIKIGIIKKN
jgi:hypothetical protein